MQAGQQTFLPSEQRTIIETQIHVCELTQIHLELQWKVKKMSKKLIRDYGLWKPSIDYLTQIIPVPIS